MALDIGDVVPLTITITNAAGIPENAGSVSITVTAPDGTTTSQSGVTGSSGVYTFNYTIAQAGRHVVAWLATGLNSGAFTDYFHVNPADDGTFISLSQFKAHIKKTDSADDEKLRDFISGACSTITDRVGQVAPATVIEDLDADCYGRVKLNRWPIIAITSVVRLPSMLSIAQDTNGTGLGWVLETGILNTRYWGRVRVTYRAGRTPIPANFVLAGLELTAHLWRTSQLNPSGGRPPIGADETIVNGVTFAMPYNVRQLLGLDKRGRSGVWI